MTDLLSLRPPTGSVAATPMHAPQAQYRDGSPIVLTARVVLQPNSPNGPNVVALKNPTPHPINIQEIRFNLHADLPGLSPGVIGAKFDLSLLDGRTLPVSKGHVPLWLFDLSEQLSVGESFQDQQTFLADFQAAATYKWVLKSPLRIEPGELLNVSFQHFGLIPTDVDATVIYSGRVVVGHPKPSEIVVPYVAGWQSPQFNMNYFADNYAPGGPNDATVDESSDEQDLATTGLSEDVHVHQLIGRLLTPSLDFNANANYSDEVQNMVDSLFFANLYTSRGYEITKDFYPFRLLFARDTRSFPCDLILSPGDYLIAQVRATMGNITDLAGVIPTFDPVAPMVGMVGERIVRI